MNVISSGIRSSPIYWRCSSPLVSGDEYVVTNNATYIAATGPFQPVNTHIIGIGFGANYSVIKDSEYMRHEYTIYDQNSGGYYLGQLYR
jgi:hexokinase